MISRKCPRKITISRIMRRLMSNYERIKDHKMSHKNITFHEKKLFDHVIKSSWSLFWASKTSENLPNWPISIKNDILHSKNELLLTNIVVGLTRKEFESVRRWICVLEENRVFLFLFWFVTINQPLSLWCITIPKKWLIFK